MGLAICNRKGDIITSYLVDSEIKFQISKVQEQLPDLL